MQQSLASEHKAQKIYFLLQGSTLKAKEDYRLYKIFPAEK